MSQSYYSGSDADTEPYSPRTHIESSRSTKKYPWEKSPPKHPDAPVPRLLTPELPVPRLMSKKELKLEEALVKAKEALKRHTSLYPKGSVQTNLKKDAKHTAYGRVLADLTTDVSNKYQELVTQRNMDSYRENLYGNTKRKKTRKSNTAQGRRKRKTYRSKGKCKTGGKRKKRGGNKKRKTRKRNRKRRSRRTRK